MGSVTVIADSRPALTPKDTALEADRNFSLDWHRSNPVDLVNHDTFLASMRRLLQQLRVDTRLRRVAHGDCESPAQESTYFSKTLT